MRNQTCIQAVLLLVLTAFSAGASSATDIQAQRFEPKDPARERTVPVKVYLAEAGEARPVVLFSHGLGGSRENNSYLANHWVNAGYVAVFMQHPGSDSDVWRSVRPRERMQALKAAASARSSRDRFGDVSFVIDMLEQWNQHPEHPLRGKLDLERIGMSGHSFGAVTTLAVAGRKFPLNQSFAEPRIDAFLAMSPQPGKGRAATHVFGHLTQPILCMTGTKDGSPLDSSMNPEVRKEVYAALPEGDKYQLVLEGAEHSAFGDSRSMRGAGRNPKHHPAIQAISTKFWDAYLKDDESAKRWLQSQQPITTTGLGASDLWEWK